jgi:hypothetical protein
MAGREEKYRDVMVEALELRLDERLETTPRAQAAWLMRKGRTSSC